MKIIRVFIVLVLILCGVIWAISRPDYFANRKEAKELINKGWIPELIPSSAYDINEKHDLDFNIGWGEFKFKENDLATFRKILAIESVEIEQSQSTKDFIKDLGREYEYFFIKNQSSLAIFLMAIDWSNLECRFWLNIRGFEKSSNRVRAGFSPALPTPPCMRDRTGRFISHLDNGTSPTALLQTLTLVI